jgi:hypothetical protein
LEAGDPTVATRVLAGSVPPGNDALWDHCRAAGYDTDLLRRVENDAGRLVEQGVDEILHLKIANALLDHAPPQTLVVASGDGSVSAYNTGFPSQVQRALRQGWDVEVWSWMEQLTSAYDPICRAYPGRIVVRVLDPYYHSLTFVQGGVYPVRTGATVGIPTRLAQPLTTTASLAPLAAAA